MERPHFIQQDQEGPKETIAPKKRFKPSLDHPGQSGHLISAQEASTRDPLFFDTHSSTKLRIRQPDGTTLEFTKVDWEIDSSPYWNMHNAIVTDETGNPTFERSKYLEAPAVNIVAYGFDKTGAIRIGVMSQLRSHADNAFDLESKESLLFEHIPMGFVDKAAKKTASQTYESIEEAATRELREEMGIVIIKNMWRPEYPANYVNPSYHGSWGDIVFAEVDLEQLELLTTNKEESILDSAFIGLDELFGHLRAGKTEFGLARMAVSNSAVLIFLSHLTEIAQAGKNQRIIDTEIETWKKMRLQNPSGYKEFMKIRSEEQKKLRRL